MNITSYMTDDHRQCDDAFVEFENIIQEKDWQSLESNWDNFSKLLLKHFDMEETILFPAFEAATGMTQGPTMVMRSEHQHMRNLMEQIGAALSSQNEEECLGISETLMIMIQQHNMKEEQMLYPMADQHVDTANIISQMKNLV